jgi:hypothetical protein
LDTAKDAQGPLRRARVAIVGVDDDTATMLKQLFDQFKISAEILKSEAAQRLHREKFDGCVVRLQPGADDVLKAARTNAANSRMVVYGVCTGIGDARPYSKYGINALLMLPLDRREALKAIKGTHLLVLHEFRRYVRIPLAVEVTATVSGSAMKATSHEVSGGGMSLQLPVRLKHGDVLELTLSLPNGPAVKIPAVVRWTKEAEQLTGVRFEDEDARTKVKTWIDKYLGYL